MQNPTQYAACPNCGQSNAKKISYTWWGGALGSRLFNHVKCQNCGTEYNGKTGKSNRQSIIIYFVSLFVITFCVCGGFAAVTAFLNNR